MPWRSVVPMEEKIRFIGDYLNGVFYFIELCERYGIWEGYYGPIWLGRFDERIMLIMDQRGRYFRRKV